MATITLDKGKGRAVVSSPSKRRSPSPSTSRYSGSSSTDSDSDSDSESSSGSSSSGESSSDEEITQEYLESLLRKAKENAVASSSRKTQTDAVEVEQEEEIIKLDGHSKPEEPPLPPLDPGPLPTYIEYGASRREGPKSTRDLDTEKLEKLSSSVSIPDVSSIKPPELGKSGKPLTKKERKALKTQTAGPSWYDMPAPDAADLPKMYREVEALRLRNQLDPKRFYRKDEGEGKGIKGLPKYFAIGTIVPEKTPFGSGSADNLTRNQRKRTLVDELVDDAEAKSYAKKKFKELQAVRGARGRGTLAKKKSLRKPKW